MMFPILGYTVAISTALCLLGVALERLTAHFKWPRRSIWITALVASIAAPLAAMLLDGTPATRAQPSTPTPSVLTPATPAQRSVTPNAMSVESNEATPVRSSRKATGRTLPLPSDRTIFLIWGVASAALTAFLLIATARLRRRASLWEHATVLGIPVLITDDMGPALLGAWRPKIIVPRWFLKESPDTQQLILSHELQHRAAHDPLLLWWGIYLAVLVPWNLPMWWQLRRLRLALELDCDARIVRHGVEPLTYGRVLLAVTRRSLDGPIGAIAMSRPVSALEERIMILERTPERYARLRTLAAVVIGLAAVGAVTAMDAPAVSSAPPAKAADGVPSLPLLLPPLERNAQLSKLGELGLQRAVERYPQLVTGPETDERYVIAIALRPDGTLQNSELRAVGDRDVNDVGTAVKRIFSTETGELHTGKSKGAQLGNGQVLRASVSLIIAQQRPGFDESRSTLRVQQIVREKYRDLMRSNSSGVIVRVTVFLTEDGKIERENIENPAKLVQPDYDDPQFPAKFAAHLTSVLGVDSSRFGAMGFTLVEDSLMRSASETAATAASNPAVGFDANRIMVHYAWPRRAGETGPYMPQFTKQPDLGIDLEAVRVLLEHYVPDAFKVKDGQAGDATLVMDWTGKVIRSGRVVPLVGMPFQESLQKQLMPEYKLGQFMPARIKNAKGESAEVLLFWEPDSTAKNAAP